MGYRTSDQEQALAPSAAYWISLILCCLSSVFWEGNYHVPLLMRKGIWESRVEDLLLHPRLQNDEAFVFTFPAPEILRMPVFKVWRNITCFFLCVFCYFIFVILTPSVPWAQHVSVSLPMDMSSFCSPCLPNKKLQIPPLCCWMKWQSSWFRFWILFIQTFWIKPRITVFKRVRVSGSRSLTLLTFLSDRSEIKSPHRGWEYSRASISYFFASQSLTLSYTCVHSGEVRFWERTWGLQLAFPSSFEYSFDSYDGRLQ